MNDRLDHRCFHLYAFLALVVGAAASCSGASDVPDGADCFEYSESQRAVDSFAEPLSGMERTPAEVLALHGQGHPVEVVSASDPQLRWDAEVVAVALDDVGTFREYGPDCPGREVLIVRARYELTREGEATPFFSVTGWIEVSAGARDETLFAWYDVPVGMSDAFEQTFLAEPGIDPTKNVFTLNVHTDPDYSFCGEFAVRTQEAMDLQDAYEPAVVIRTPEEAAECRASSPP